MLMRGLELQPLSAFGARDALFRSRAQILLCSAYIRFAEEIKRHLDVHIRHIRLLLDSCDMNRRTRAVRTLFDGWPGATETTPCCCNHIYLHGSLFSTQLLTPH